MVDERACAHEVGEEGEGKGCGMPFLAIKALTVYATRAHNMRNSHPMIVRANACPWCRTASASRAS
eukprot:4533110-Pyramimonas_sp.AAC.1